MCDNSAKHAFSVTWEPNPVLNKCVEDHICGALIFDFMNEPLCLLKLVIMTKFIFFVQKCTFQNETINSTKMFLHVDFFLAVTTS